MIWSRFNFIETIGENDYYLYNSYSNCLLKLNANLYLFFKNLTAGVEFVDDSHILSKDEYSFFVKSYILVENDDDLVNIMHMHSMARLFSKKHLVLTIAPTQACNFSCTYCYEKWRHGGVMTNETAQSIISYVRKAIDKDGLESVSLNWYGGEPLLQYKRVVELSKQFRDLGLNITENIVITNGYYFTPDVIDDLIEADIKEVQITIDGVKSIHDSRRPLSNGKGTFDTIIQNLDRHFSSKNKDNLVINLRVNIDKRNVNDYLRLNQWLTTRYESEKLFVYPGIIVLDESDSCSNFCLKRNEVTTLFLKLYNHYGIISESLYPDNINMECLARSPYGSMLIGPDGKIYKCFEELGDDSKAVGNINDEFCWANYTILSRYAIGIDHYSDSQCRKCSYLPICRGGCPIQRYNNIYKGRHNDCCTPYKGRIRDYIEIYAKLLHESKV